MALTRALEDRIAAFDNQIKSDQIALLATAPLIRSTAAPSTGLQLPNMPITSASDVFCRFPTWTTLPMLMYEYVCEPALHRSCCRSSKQDGSASLGMWHEWATRVTCPGPYICQFARYPRTGGAAQDVRVTPGFGPWKQTFSHSIMA